MYRMNNQEEGDSDLFLYTEDGTHCSYIVRSIVPDFSRTLSCLQDNVLSSRQMFIQYLSTHFCFSAGKKADHIISHTQNPFSVFLGWRLSVAFLFMMPVLCFGYVATKLARHTTFYTLFDGDKDFFYNTWCNNYVWHALSLVR